MFKFRRSTHLVWVRLLLLPRGGLVMVVAGLSFLLTFGAAVPAYADLPPNIEVAEALMEAQGHDAAFLGRYFGPDPNAVLHFTWAADPVAKTFSYTLAPGGTYLGESLSLSCSGAYEAATGKWVWTSFAQRGSYAWEDDGTGEFSGAARGYTFKTRTVVPLSPGNWLDLAGQMTISPGDSDPVTLWVSDATYTFTVNDVPMATAGGFDGAVCTPGTQFPPVSSFTWKMEWVEIQGQKFYVQTTCPTPYEFEVAVCPEPAVLGPLAVGLAVLARRRRD